MPENITLSCGAVVSHKPYLNGAIEAFILTHYVISGVKIEKHSEMNSLQWIEYCQIIQNKGLKHA